MRVRLRPPHDTSMLALLYARPHDHTRWPDHVERVKETIELGRELITNTGPPEVIADLSCGDAAIPRGVAASCDVTPRLLLGDLAPGYEINGSIEQTILLLDNLEYGADLFICCETIEHLDDPDAVLAIIRERATTLLLSTPLSEAGGLNPEHYWSWDADGVQVMLERAGWTPVLYRDVSCEVAGSTWAYQIWGCT